MLEKNMWYGLTVPKKRRISSQQEKKGSETKQSVHASEAIAVFLATKAIYPM
jgi:hypothetical protein